MDYAANEVIAPSSKPRKELEAKLNDICIRFLKEVKAGVNVDIKDELKNSCQDSCFKDSKVDRENGVGTESTNQFQCKCVIPFPSGKQLFMRRFLMKDFYLFTNNIKDAYMKFLPNECRIKGKYEPMQRLGDFLLKTMTKIGVTEVKIKLFGIHEFLQSSEGKYLIARTEAKNRCTIQLKSNNVERESTRTDNTTAQSSQSTPSHKDAAVVVHQSSLQTHWDFANIKVSFILGEVNKQKTDIIVNTVNKFLDLRAGKLSRTIIHEAGVQIQQELKSKYPTGIKDGEFAISRGGNLSCKYIFHACVPFTNGKNADEIMSLVSKLLEMADGIHAKSISIPALGTGGLGYPPTVSAQSILGAISSFAQKNRQTQIKRVNVVVFPKDDEVARIFRSVLSSEESVVPDNKQKEALKDFPKMESSIEISQEVELQIFSDNPSQRQLTEKLLQEEFLTAFKKEEEKDININRLTLNQIKDVEKIGIQYGIKVSIDRTNNQLTMEGFRTDGMLQVHKAMGKLILDAVGEHHKALLEVTPSFIKWQCQQQSGWLNFKPLISSEVERAYRTKEALPSGIFVFIDAASDQKYSFDFNTQIVVYESKRGKTKTKFRRYEKTKEGKKFPKFWDPMSETENLKIVEIPPGSDEFIKVSQHFVSKGAIFPIKKLQRIQNKSLYHQYNVKKRDIDLHNPIEHQNEQKLFHGSSVGPIPNINENGFNRSYCGVNGTSYGLGVYFAVNSAYSLEFAKPDSQGSRYMYRVRVLTGEFIETDSSTKYLPNKPGTNRPYDSGGSSKRGIYVIFHDAQAYPEYLITF